MHFSSVMRAACPAYFILLDLITLKVFGEGTGYEDLLCGVFHTNVHQVKVRQ
jgi:hypothetical protein